MKQTRLLPVLLGTLLAILLIAALPSGCQKPAPEPEPSPSPAPIAEAAPEPTPEAEVDEILPAVTPLPDDPLDEAAETVTLLDPAHIGEYRAGTSLLITEPVDLQRIAEALLSCPALKTADARKSGLTHEEIVTLRGSVGDVAVIETVTVNGQTFDSNAPAVTLTVSDAQEAEDALDLFTDLEHVTLSGTALKPEEILSLRERLPEAAFVCDVDLYGKTVSTDSEALDLSAVPESELASVVSLFPSLQFVTLGEMPPATVAALKAGHEGLSATYQFRGQTVSESLTALDLSGAGFLTAAELDALCLTAPDLSSLTLDDPDDAQLSELCVFDPREKGVTLHCTLNVLEQAFDADAERIDFGDRKLTDEETAGIERVIPVMTNLKEVDLYESRLTKETMDRLFDGYPDLFFGWTFTIWDGFYTVRSDATAFSSYIGLPGSHRWLLTEDDFSILRYCKGLQALDLGHCGIRNLDFLRNWPHMKILILADTPLTDIHVIAELTELEYLELFLTTPDSYEPLTHLKNLIDLNLCHTKKEGNQYRDDEEIMMLTGIKTLERLWISKTLTAEQAQMLRDNLPGVEFDFYSTGSTDKGWREHPRYYIMRKCFKTGTYIPFD